MPKKDKAKAKQQAEDARGAVTEEVSKTVDDAQHAAGGVRDSLKDAVASCRDSVETVAETTTHAMSSVTHAVSSAIEKVCLPFPRARAILAALQPSTLTRRPSSPCPRNARRDDVFVSWDSTKYYYSNRRQSAEALDANKDGKVDARDAAEVGRRCSPAKCIIS